jgi:hypothetical protein
VAIARSIAGRIGVAALTLALACVPAALAPASASAGVEYLKSCTDFGDPGLATAVNGPVWQGSSSGSFATSNRCPQGGSFEVLATTSAGNLASAKWQTTAPASLQIVQAYTRAGSVLVNHALQASGYRAIFFWNGGRQEITPGKPCCGQMDYGAPISASIGPSRFFGFGVYCARRSCPAVKGALLDVHGIDLEGVDNTPPAISATGADNLWYQRDRWVRGSWPVPFSARDDSGICSAAIAVAGQRLAGPAAAPDQHSWTQCPGAVTMNHTVDTAAYPNGPLSLTLGAADAASPANVAAPSETVNLDNSPVGLSLGGPADAPSTAGTQYLGATGSAGPSGVAGIACALDGGAYRTYAGAGAQIPVQGIGQHQVLCYAWNHSINVHGRPALSPAQSRNLSIRQPSAITASFKHVGLRCRHFTKRVYVPGRLVRLHRHGKVIDVHRRGHVRRVGGLRCRALVLGADGNKRVEYGARTAVSGSLQALDGTALGGQSVRILTAPDNGSGSFTPATTTTTSADGGWSATLPAGPSRLVEAVYAGARTTEPATSQPIHVIVPASVSLAVSPRRTHWGGTITISGRLRGGYIPPAGELVVLRIGWRGGSTEIGHLYAGADGSFHAKYTFLRGNGAETYRLWAQTALESDYPYTTGSSRAASVHVGP